MQPRKMLENILLLVIVVQGFAVWYYEYQTYQMNKERYDERKKWREDKKKSALKKKEQDGKPSPN